MTIAQPNRQAQIAKAMRLLFLGIAVSGVVSIFLYNQMVGQRTAFRAATKMLDSLQLSNADLKNQYYALLDDKHLSDAALALGYVKEPNPKYLRVGASVALAR